MLPDTDLLYLREDELEWRRSFWGDGFHHQDDTLENIFYRLIECRKNSERRMDELEAEIERLQIASGEVIQRAGDEVI